MALLHKVIAFQIRTGTGSASVTGVGFRPKVVIFYGSDTSFGGADGSAAMFSMGFDDGVTSYGRAVETFDNFTTGASASGSLIGISILRVNSTALTPSFQLQGAISSMDADGFTYLLIQNTQSLGEWFFADCFGGDDLDYELLTFVPANGTGVQTIGGLSLAPKALVSFYLGTVSAAGPDLNVEVTYVAPTNAVTLATSDRDSPGIPTNNFRYLRDGRAFADMATNGAIIREATGVTLTSDGFTINWTTATGGVPKYAVLALGGAAIGNAAAGVYTQKTTTGTQAISLPAIGPAALLFGTVSAASSASVGDGLSVSIGAADVGATQGGAWAGARDNVSPTVCARSMSTSALVSGFPPAVSGGSTTLVLVEDFVSATTSSFTMNDTVADGTAREIMYLVLGSTTLPGSIMVTKVTVPSGDATVFDFTVGGGLDPDSFTLTDGQSQAYEDVAPGSGYSIVETQIPGVTTTYAVSNASPNTNISVADSEAVTVVVTNRMPQSEVIRFQRIFPHVSDEQFMMFCSRLEFEFQRGVGIATGQGSVPLAMVSVSYDNGDTWQPERFLAMGEMGEYLQRMYTTRYSSSRDFVWKLVVTDPVLVAFLAAYGDFEGGTH